MASHQLLHDAYFIRLHTSPICYVRSGTFRQGSGASVNYSFSCAFHLFFRQSVLIEKESLIANIFLLHHHFTDSRTPSSVWWTNGHDILSACEQWKSEYSRKLLFLVVDCSSQGRSLKLKKKTDFREAFEPDTSFIFAYSCDLM